MILASREPDLRTNRRALPLYPPSDPRGRWVRLAQDYRGGAPIIARLLAWINAVSAHEDPDLALAAMDSADLRERERAEGHYTEAARLLSEQADPELRQAFVREDCLEIILGHWDVDLGWHMGLAGLTYMECMATTARLNGDSPAVIAKSDTMLSRRRRKMGETVPVENIYKYLCTAARKLRSRFDQTPYDAALYPDEEQESWDEHFGRVLVDGEVVLEDGELIFEDPELLQEDEENPPEELFNP